MTCYLSLYFKELDALEFTQIGTAGITNFLKCKTIYEQNLPLDVGKY